MFDPISPPAARRPEEALELVSAALSDGDLEAALAQYERGAVLQPWAAGAGWNGGGLRSTLAYLMALRLPLSATVQAVLVTGDLALVLGEREIAGPAPLASGSSSAGGVPAWSGVSRTAPGAWSPRPGASPRVMLAQPAPERHRGPAPPRGRGDGPRCPFMTAPTSSRSSESALTR